MDNFGTRLKQTMEQRGISASELSRESGIGKNLISYYIHGRCLAKQDKVYLLAKALHVDPGWLMTGVEPDKGHDVLSIVIPDSALFKKITEHMSYDDYQTVMAIYSKTYERMKEEGLI